MIEGEYVKAVEWGIRIRSKLRVGEIHETKN